MTRFAYHFCHNVNLLHWWLCKQKHVVKQHCQLCGMQWHVLSLAVLLLGTFEIFGTGTSLQSALPTKERLEPGWGTPQAPTSLKSKAKAGWLSAWDWRGQEFTIPCKAGVSQYDIPESFTSSWQLCFQAICNISPQRFQVFLLHSPPAFLQQIQGSLLLSPVLLCIFATAWAAHVIVFFVLPTSSAFSFSPHPGPLLRCSI